MQLSLDKYSRRRLVEIRWLFQRGVQESLLSNPRNALVSIPLLFTAAEQLISLLANRAGLAKSPTQQAENWAKKAEAIDKQTNGNPKIGTLSDLFHVASLRNGSLHSGNLYSRMEVQNAQSVIRGFLSRVVSDFYGVDLWSLSVTQMVKSPWVQSRLLAAELAIAEGDRDGAVLAACAALNLCLVTAQGYVGGIPIGPQEHLRQAPASQLDGESSKAEQASVRLISEVQAQMDTVWRAMGCSALFHLCDRDSVNRFLSLRLIINGPARIRLQEPPLYVKVNFPSHLALDDVEFLFGFTVDLAIELEAMGLDLESPTYSQGHLSLLNSRDIASADGWFPVPEGWDGLKSAPTSPQNVPGRAPL